jgi:parvulin-like peptidyl-prolyl isomerase
VALAGLLLPAILAGVLSGCARSTDEQRRVVSEPAPTVSEGSLEATSEPPPATHTAPPPTVRPTPTAPAPLAAIVNGQFVLLEEYEARLEEHEAALKTGGLDSDGIESRQDMAQVRNDALESIIDLVLIEQAAAFIGVTVQNEELSARVKADIEAGGGQAAFDDWLAATGQTEVAYTEMVRQSMVTQRVMDAIASGVAHEFEQVHARHIAVHSEEEAQAIADRVKQGAGFEAVAGELSEDEATREDGGDLGWFPRGLVEPELEEAAFSLQPGEVSGPVFYGDAYHVVQVVERESERRLPEELRARLVLAAFEEWLDEERARAEIQRLVGE